MKAKKAAFNYTRLQYTSLNEIKPFKTSFTLNAVLIIDELLTATLLLKGLSKLSSVFFFKFGHGKYTNLITRKDGVQILQMYTTVRGVLGITLTKS